MNRKTTASDKAETRLDGTVEPIAVDQQALIVTMIYRILARSCRAAGQAA